eukprot:1234590-Rhodomonas_salina.1
MGAWARTVTASKLWEWGYAFNAKRSLMLQSKSRGHSALYWRKQQLCWNFYLGPHRLPHLRCCATLSACSDCLRTSSTIVYF